MVSCGFKEEVEEEELPTRGGAKDVFGREDVGGGALPLGAGGMSKVGGGIAGESVCRGCAIVG